MKRLNEFTRSELAALTNEQIENLIDTECAYEGAPISLEKPVLVDVPELPQPDVTYYNVYGILLTDREEANNLADYLNRLTSMCNIDYDYDHGIPGLVKYKYVTDYLNHDICVEVNRAYTRASYNEFKAIFEQREKIENANKKQIDDFKKLSAARTSIIGKVSSAVRDAIAEEDEIFRRAAIYKKYIELADGNETVAARFYTQHFGGDAVPHDVIMEYLIMDAKEEEHESV